MNFKKLTKSELYWRRVAALEAYIEKTECVLPDLHFAFKIKLLLLMQKVEYV